MSSFPPVPTPFPTCPAARTHGVADILHMRSVTGAGLMLFAGSQTQLVAHCGRQETWPSLAAARLGGKLTLGGERLEAVAQVSLHMLVVSGQARLRGPLQGKSITSEPTSEAWKGERGAPWHRAEPICSLLKASLA